MTSVRVRAMRAGREHHADFGADTLDLVASAHGDVVLHARRLVAQRCLYGVDKNPLAVSLARLSLWLVTLAKDEPFTFVDHALRHGDSLVGLDLEQIRGFHWKPGAQLEFARELIDTALQEALDARQRILALASQDDTREKEHLLWDANDALAPVRLIADLIVGAFFAEAKDKARESERKRRLDLVVRWLESRREPPEELLAMQRALRERVPAFHWWVEFPEVFYGERPDPLDGGRVNRVAWMDAFVGNPPFMGGNQLAVEFGESLRDWLLSNVEPSHGNSDICAFFVRRCDRLIGQAGVYTLVATNTIGQGDTRATGLQPVVATGGIIFDATRSFAWPGAAQVEASIVGVIRGISVDGARLDGLRCSGITSRLRVGSERPDPVALGANSGRLFRGSVIYGSGFLLEPEEAHTLLGKPQNGVIIKRCLGGEDVNSSPEQAPSRYVIDFDGRSVDEAASWPDLLGVLATRVKPERDKVNRDIYRRNWWLFAEPQKSLYAALHGNSQAMVLSQVSKHLAVARVPTGQVFAHTLNVFAFAGGTGFALLQSRVHEFWARLLSSSMRTDLRYVGSDCFDTFPFPQPDPRAVIPTLEEIGERLYTARAKYMLDTQQGLTQTYNQLKDPRVSEPRVVALRRLHEEMDRAVVAAYGWSDLVVPAYGTPVTEAEKKALARFEDEVIDRLFALNAVRAAEERAAREKADGTPGTKAAKGGRKKKGDGGSGQGSLGIG